MRRMTMLALAGALVAAPAAAQGEGAADTVRFAFGWRPGMTAEVAYAYTRSSGLQGETERAGARVEYTLTTEADPAGLRVRHAGGRVVGVEGDTGTPTMQAALVAASLAVPLSFVVDGDGTPTGDSDMGDLPESLLEAAEAQRVGDTGTSWSALGDPALVAAGTEGLWFGAVAIWNGQRVTVGSRYEADTGLEAHFAPGQEIAATMQFGVVGRVACFEGGPADACVELDASVAADRAETALLVEGYLAELGISADAGRDLLERVRLYTETRLVAEPGTLRPHRYTTTVRFVVLGEKYEDPHVIETVESESLAWRWLP